MPSSSEPAPAPPHQVIAAWFKDVFAGGHDGDGQRQFPPPAPASSFQAVRSVEVLGHMMSSKESPGEEGGPAASAIEAQLHIEFTINVRRANHLQD
eukprot:2704672-Prymnesium_polylepis.1